MKATQLTTFCATALAGFLAPAILAQQTPQTFVRDVCVKVRDGKAEEYRGYLRDVSLKLNQYLVKEGRIEWWHAEQAVVPAGDSARCDYHLVSGYNGFPPEPMSAAEFATAVERAKIPISPTEALKQRDAISRLVNIDYWRLIGHAGGRADEGTYIRRNFYKIKPGRTVAEWAKLETSGWMPFAEALAKEQNGRTGWAAISLVMPSGQSLAYQAGTVDIFPDWKSLGSVGNSFNSIWSKVHPDLSSSDYLNLVNNVVERPSIEVYRIRHSIRK